MKSRLLRPPPTKWHGPRKPPNRRQLAEVFFTRSLAVSLSLDLFGCGNQETGIPKWAARSASGDLGTKTCGLPLFDLEPRPPERDARCTERLQHLADSPAQSFTFGAGETQSLGTGWLATTEQNRPLQISPPPKKKKKGGTAKNKHSPRPHHTHTRARTKPPPLTPETRPPRKTTRQTVGL